MESNRATRYGVCTRKGNARTLQLQRLKYRMFLDVARQPVMASSIFGGAMSGSETGLRAAESRFRP
jgi:hypothetical protein